LRRNDNQHSAICHLNMDRLRAHNKLMTADADLNAALLRTCDDE
jgi:hypothetical protein